MLAGVAAAVTLVSCTAGTEDEQRVEPTTHEGRRYPGDRWESVTPAAAGFDEAALEQLAEEARRGGSSCLVVTRDGAVVREHHWKGDEHTPHEGYSVTKSVTSVLVGIAQDDGKLDLDDRAADYIPQWRGTPAEAVTIRNLLSNDSGRYWSLVTDYQEMATDAADKTAFAIGLNQTTAPGKVWAYNNSAIQTLSAVLKTATGEDVDKYARSRLFDPLGMKDSWLSKDRSGGVMTFSGLQSTCLDLARFGYLMLRDGMWKGKQIVSSDYVKESTRKSSTSLNAAYGLLWWVNQEGPVASTDYATSAGAPAPHGQLVPDAPPDTFWAHGLHEQIVAVIPAKGVVAVRMGARPPDHAPFGRAQLTMGVLRALT